MNSKTRQTLVLIVAAFTILVVSCFCLVAYGGSLEVEGRPVKTPTINTRPTYIQHTSWNSEEYLRPLL